MEVLARIEGFLEGMIEGVFRRFSRGSTHPVEIARRIYRTMENERRVSVLRTYVPNEYRVALHPDDMQGFSSLVRALSIELCQTVRERAERERYSFVGPVLVEFITDGSLRPGCIRVDAAFVDGGDEVREDVERPGIQEEDTTPHDAIGAGDTRTFTAPESDTGDTAGGPEPGAGVPRMIVSEGAMEDAPGEEFPIMEGRITLGRAASNSIVIRDGSVSREHVEIRRDGRDYVVRDLGSTNGTFVNGRRVSECVLHDGDILEIGKSRLVFRIR